jgi:hypothetical protein
MEETMAKKIAKKSRTKPAAAKPKPRRAPSQPFLSAEDKDFAELMARARKGPQRDWSGARVLPSSEPSDPATPRQREN